MLIRKVAVLGILSGCLLNAGVLAQDSGESIITVPSVPVGAAVSLGGTVVPFKEVTFSQ